MFKIICARLKQGHHTIKYPKAAPSKLFDRFIGRPILDISKCPAGCNSCVEACPTDAITITGNRHQLDIGKCIFCAKCMEACPNNAISFTNDHRLCSRNRQDLIITDNQDSINLAKEMEAKIKKFFGRSLKLRQVSAGGCNACEADTNVLTTLAWDLGRFGIQFVASPRHADGLLITGPVTQNMHLALKKTYDALPEPKVVIAVGACAISGGPYIDLAQANNGAESVVPVDLFIAGCPPHPLTILDGLLRFMGNKGKGMDAIESELKKR